MQPDALLQHHDRLEARVAAWEDSWAHRGEARSAAVATVLSLEYLGEPLARRIEQRLLEGRREIDNEIARFAGMLAAAIALACRAGDTDDVERSTRQTFERLGRHEADFAIQMAELRPLVELYRRLQTAVGRGG